MPERCLTLRGNLRVDAVGGPEASTLRVDSWFRETLSAVMNASPLNFEQVRNAALSALGDIKPAGPPQGNDESHALMMASRTNRGQHLPPYYLVYLLLVDLLGFANLGQWEKVAWIVPIRYSGRLYSIEHRKMGLGIFAPTY